VTTEAERLAKQAFEAMSAFWDSFHAGNWEFVHHDVMGHECPEDDTCECLGRASATLMSKAYAELLSWMRRTALKEGADD
jgi:hypothetical protein